MMGNEKAMHMGNTEQRWWAAVRGSWRGRAVLAGLVLLLGAGLWSLPGVRAAKPEQPAPTAKAALTVRAVQPQKQQWPIRLLANGSVAAWEEASVAAEVGGLRVQSLLAQVGDRVQSGQVLATFADEGVQADVALARAALREAQANATDAAANAARARSLEGSGALSAQQIAQYLTQEQTARARVESAQAQLDAQTLRLRHTQLRAPDAGVVLARNATVGGVVGAGVEMFRLMRQGRLEWRAEVTASELARVAVGTPVRVRASDGSQANGRVRMLAPTVDATTRTGLVYVDLLGLQPAAPGKASAPLGQHFKPGMYAQGELLLGQSAAWVLPQTAVVVRDGWSYVMRLEADQRVSQRKVQTGRTQGEGIEIQSGLEPQDKVVAVGAGFLAEGDKVQVLSSPAAP